MVHFTPLFGQEAEAKKVKKPLPCFLLPADELFPLSSTPASATLSNMPRSRGLSACVARVELDSLEVRLAVVLLSGLFVPTFLSPGSGSAGANLLFSGSLLMLATLLSGDAPAVWSPGVAAAMSLPCGQRNFDTVSSAVKHGPNVDPVVVFLQV